MNKDQHEVNAENCLNYVISKGLGQEVAAGHEKFCARGIRVTNVSDRNVVIYVYEIEKNLIEEDEDE